MTPMRANIVGPPVVVRPVINASTIAALPFRGLVIRPLGGLEMYLAGVLEGDELAAARGNGIGSSTIVSQPRAELASLAPADSTQPPLHGEFDVFCDCKITSAPARLRVMYRSFGKRSKYDGAAWWRCWASRPYECFWLPEMRYVLASCPKQECRGKIRNSDLALILAVLPAAQPLPLVPIRQ